MANKIEIPEEKTGLKKAVEDELTDLSMLFSLAALLVGLLVIIFISANAGLVTMLALYSLLGIYFMINNSD